MCAPHFQPKVTTTAITVSIKTINLTHAGLNDLCPSVRVSGRRGLSLPSCQHDCKLSASPVMSLQGAATADTDANMLEKRSEMNMSPAQEMRFTVPERYTTTTRGLQTWSN